MYGWTPKTYPDHRRINPERLIVVPLQGGGRKLRCDRFNRWWLVVPGSTTPRRCIYPDRNNGHEYDADERNFGFMKIMYAMPPLLFLNSHTILWTQWRRPRALFRVCVKLWRVFPGASVQLHARPSKTKNIREGLASSLTGSPGNKTSYPSKICLQPDPSEPSEPSFSGVEDHQRRRTSRSRNNRRSTRRKNKVSGFDSKHFVNSINSASSETCHHSQRQLKYLLMSLDNKHVLACNNYSIHECAAVF